MPTNYQRRRIISLWTLSKEKATFTELERILALEGILTTHQTIKATVNRWKKTGSVNDVPGVDYQRRCQRTITGALTMPWQKTTS